MVDKLKTLDEVNEEREGSEVLCWTFDSKIYWKPTGIATEFGGEFLEANALFMSPVLLHGGNASLYRRVKCSRTGRLGWWHLDGSVREVIEKVTWDETISSGRES